ncbi:condensation domain-containing protein [Phycicoccus flavus]|uniref:hypothetical protein n=1 Tax=Phycicoccus flavus TaxID=2502783 RepID=UPI000FEB82AA|nr:hypothetical protein [Phycicoccus flavus]NHA67696.1 hypothetical protein [Phycicoccus flavus]
MSGEPAGVAGPAPEVTGAERDVVVACLVSDEPATYNVPVHVRFEKPVDPARLRDAVAAVLVASPTLRRTYVRDGRRIRRGPAATPVVDLLRIAPADLDTVARARRVRVLDPVLVRAAVCEVASGTGPPQVWLHLNAHHALVDGIGLVHVLRAVLDTYRTGTLVVPDEPCAPEGSDRTVRPVRPSPAALPGPRVDADVDERSAQAFLAALAALRVPGTGVGVVRRDLTVPGTPTYASTLAALVPALGLWCDIDVVVVSSGLAGRTPADARAVGSFVRLEPLALDLDAWVDLGPREVLAGVGRLAATLALRSVAPAPPPRRGLVRRAEVGVVLDYKRESLVPQTLDASLGAHLVEDGTYVDCKYDLHVSVHQTGAGQQLTLTGRDLPVSVLGRLADLYLQQLRLGALRALPATGPLARRHDPDRPAVPVPA